ncbi:MAG: glycosyltransferase family 39 protein [Xenococcaceae cyanobacterium MO_167.B52]|nr:glycosyltransferase family 39 protein [Xenococcaceae cyanobacterium MO_167.B52]
MLNAKRRSWLILCAIVLVIGIFFRCYNIDKKVYWHDEVYTSIRVSGYNGQEIVENIFRGKIIQPQDLLKYQKITSEKTWKDTFNKLLEHPEHPPLFYLLSRGWQEIFGSSVLSSRSLSVVISFLVFPAIFWLCWELFNSANVGLIAMVLVAVSPVHVLYAQEAREYSLWTVVILVCSASFIKAIKSKKKLWYFFYSLSLILNFYISLLSILVAFSQTVYLFLLSQFRITKLLVNGLLFQLLAVIVFSPWLLVIYQNYSILQSKTSWTNISKPLIQLIVSWSLHLSSIAIDFHPLINLLILPITATVVLIFTIISIVFLYSHTQSRVYLFIICSIMIPALGLIIPDLIQGGQKSVITRYFIPSILGIQMSIAYWLGKNKFFLNKLRLENFILLIMVGIISCSISAQENTWWNKTVGYHNPQIAKIINLYDKPLVISSNQDINVGNIISLSYLLEDKVRLLLTTSDKIPLVKQDGFSEVLIWNISEDSLIKFQEKNNCSVSVVEGEYYPRLWLVDFSTSNLETK